MQLKVDGRRVYTAQIDDLRGHEIKMCLPDEVPRWVRGELLQAKLYNAVRASMSEWVR